MSFPAKVYNDVVFNHIPIEHVATRGCLSPRARTLVDACGFQKTIVCDCGHCIRCADEAREQWATRMFLHACSDANTTSPWKHCYFVTLTYSSEDMYAFKRHPWLDEWARTFPVRDCNNELHRYVYSPSILVTSHIQNYFKRLRKSVSARYVAKGGSCEISYVYSGEYGETWARPHWHIILYSTAPLLESEVADAWGFTVYDFAPGDVRVANGRVPQGRQYHFSIGNVDFVDLMANGTFASDLVIDGKHRDPRFCFTYVAKYVRKRNDYKNPIFLDRLAQIYYQLPVTNHTVDRSMLDWSDDRTMRYRFVECNRDYVTPNKTYYDITFNDFVALCAPRFSSSTSYCIGKQYFIANCKRFETGNRDLPMFRNKMLVWPHYYSYLLALHKCPIYYEKACLSGTSFAKTDYRVVLEYFKKLRDDPFAVSDSIHLSSFGLLSDHVALKENILNRDWITLRFPLGNCRCVMDVEDGNLVFDCWMYNRSTRLYDRYMSLPLDAFCEFIIEVLEAEMKRVERSLDHLQKSLDLFNMIAQSDEAQSAIQAFISERERNQTLYHSYHKDLQ